MGDGQLARELMLAFADRTGLVGDAIPPRRYLWTDAFAVCNFLGLHRATGEARFLDLARTLVDQVHRVLGRHRKDDDRRGWLSGLSEAEGARRPTAGGLRIGKPLPERPVNEALDTDLEWERDGQYFHYLTKWMHALERMARETGERTYHAWAVDLARAAHAAFTFPSGPGRPKRMAWKMSIDLGRPLVPTMGAHDPLDGLVTYLDLQASDPTGDTPVLAGEVADMEATCAEMRWATDDPLGIGGLLADAARLSRLPDRRGLLPGVLEDAALGLRAVAGSHALRLPPTRRLAFRELGLSIGLHAVERARPRLEAQPATPAILAHAPLGRDVEDTWRSPASRRAESWTDHEDINAVMLATSLAPEGFLGE